MAIGRSISLAAYLALSRRSPKPSIEFPHARPAGCVIWGHATSRERAAALLLIASRLRLHRPELKSLLTVPQDIHLPEYSRDHVITQVYPEDTMLNARRFLEHWKPDLCLWTGGFFKPALIHLANSEALPMFLIDADVDGLTVARQRWLPELARASLNAFSSFFARNGSAAQLLRRLGVPSDDVVVTGPLQEAGVALGCNEAERDEMAQILAGRPVWLAAMVQARELDVILDAYRVASRMALRLLLILVPDNETDGSRFLKTVEKAGLKVAIWSEGEMPDENCQVLLGDKRGDLGLWYRLAPVTFMGSSLVPGFGGHDPYEPAALGSAILYGPHVGQFLGVYSRFAAAGAARIANDADTLAAAVQQLLSPDQAARMAAAAWELASRGAEVTDRIVDLVQDSLDVLEMG